MKKLVFVFCFLLPRPNGKADDYVEVRSELKTKAEHKRHHKVSIIVVSLFERRTIFWENNLSSSSATTTCVTHFRPRRGKDSGCSMIRRDFSLTNKCLSLHTRKSRDTCRAVCIGSIIYSIFQVQTLCQVLEVLKIVLQSMQIVVKSSKQKSS